MGRSDIISAAVLAALGLVTIFAVVPAYVPGDAYNGELTPSFMPYVATVLGTAAAILLLAVRLVRRRTDDGPAPLPRQSWLYVCVVTAVLVASFVLMDLFGYLAGAAAVVGGFMALARADLKVIVGTAIAFPVVLWFLFDRVLGFPLP